MLMRLLLEKSRLRNIVVRRKSVYLPKATRTEKT
jgi:hypothetical protein